MTPLDEYKVKCVDAVEKVLQDHTLAPESKGPWQNKTFDDDIDLYPVHVCGTAKEAVDLTGCWHRQMADIYNHSPDFALEATVVFYGNATG